MIHVHTSIFPVKKNWFRNWRNKTMELFIFPAWKLGPACLYIHHVSRVLLLFYGMFLWSLFFWWQGRCGKTGAGCNHHYLISHVAASWKIPNCCLRSASNAITLLMKLNLMLKTRTLRLANRGNRLSTEIRQRKAKERETLEKNNFWGSPFL